MELIHTIEKLVKGKLQVIELTAKANSREEAVDLGYNDFEANLFIDGVFVAKISRLLSKADVFAQMVDDVDWEVMYCDMVAEAA